MKPLDQFKRTPLRRYDKAPPPPPEENARLSRRSASAISACLRLSACTPAAGWAAQSAPRCC